MATARTGAKDLGIDLDKGTDAQIFRWLVACDLFGARISQDIAARAYHELDRLGVLSPQKLADANWQDLVDALGRGGYRRYDESTARELIELGQQTLETYGGSMRKLREGAQSKRALSQRLAQFTGIGPTAAQIFLRDMAPVWNL
jgi:endonuclease III